MQTGAQAEIRDALGGSRLALSLKAAEGGDDLCRPEAVGGVRDGSGDVNGELLRGFGRADGTSCERRVQRLYIRGRKGSAVGAGERQ